MICAPVTLTNHNLKDEACVSNLNIDDGWNSWKMKLVFLMMIEIRRIIFLLTDELPLFKKFSILMICMQIIYYVGDFDLLSNVSRGGRCVFLLLLAVICLIGLVNSVKKHCACNIYICAFSFEQLGASRVNGGIKSKNALLHYNLQKNWN